MLVLCALIGAVLNRFSGYTNISWLPGRNVYWAILALTLIAGFAVSWPFAAALAASVALYRLPGWYKSIDMGKNEGTLEVDAGIMYLRTLFMFPVFVYAYWFMGVQIAAVYLIVASAVSVLAYIVGNHFLGRYMKDPFWFIEPAVGASLGIAVGMLLN